MGSRRSPAPSDAAWASRRETSPPWVLGPALERIEDVDQLRPIDPSRDGMLPELLKATRLISEALGDRAFLLAEADQGPFSLATQIVGIEELLMALTDPDKEGFVRSLLEYATEQVVTYARALVAAGAHMTGMGDSIAGPDVCSPATYRQFAWPYERRIVDTLASEGTMIGLHICGDATPIIDDMVGTGSSLLAVDYKVDRSAVKEAAQGVTTLIGTVDPSGVLARGTPDDVRAAAAGGPGDPGGRRWLHPGPRLCPPLRHPGGQYQGPGRDRAERRAIRLTATYAGSPAPMPWTVRPKLAASDDVVAPLDTAGGGA